MRDFVVDLRRLARRSALEEGALSGAISASTGAVEAKDLVTGVDCRGDAAAGSGVLIMGVGDR